MNFDHFKEDIAGLCADDWGSRYDPERPQFLAGFRDCVERDGKGPTPPAELAAGAAYNSGFVAAREEFNLS